MSLDRPGVDEASDGEAAGGPTHEFIPEPRPEARDDSGWSPPPMNPQPPAPTSEPLPVRSFSIASPDSVEEILARRPPVEPPPEPATEPEPEPVLAWAP